MASAATCWMWEVDWGVAYTAAEEPAGVDELAEVIVGGINAEFARVGLPIPRIIVEPGRSIVANAGLTVYTIEAVKTIPDVKTYVAVNGGMSDNMRPMLYGARHEALIASRPDAQERSTWL